MNFQGTNPILGMGSFSKIIFDTAEFIGSDECNLCFTGCYGCAYNFVLLTGSELYCRGRNHDRNKRVKAMYMF